MTGAKVSYQYNIIEYGRRLRQELNETLLTLIDNSLSEKRPDSADYII